MVVLLNIPRKICCFDQHKTVISLRIMQNQTEKFLVATFVDRGIYWKFSFCNFLLLHSFILIQYRKYCFGVKFSKLSFCYGYIFSGPLNRKITFLADRVCLRLCVSLSTAQFEINNSRKFKFGRLNIHFAVMILNLFMNMEH